MLDGRPFLQYQELKKMMARSSAMMLVLVGTMRTSDPSLSVMVSIQSYPVSNGSGPMKSIAIEEPCWSGMGSGWSGPAGCVVGDLLRKQSGHDKI